MLASLAVGLLFSRPELLTLDNKEVRLFPAKARSGVVAFFILADCPIARGYSPEINRIRKEFTPKGFDFKVVYTETSGSSKELSANASAFGYQDWCYRDGSLSSRAEAKISPTAAVFTPGGQLLYTGRIDNLYAGLGKLRAKATTHDLRDVLEARVRGERASVRRTTAIGCVIPGN